MPRTVINGIGIYYEVHGDGYPFVLSHGFVGSTSMWQGQVEAFCRKYRLITWDMRAHGRSDIPDDPSQYTVEIMVDDLYQLLRNLGVEKAVVGGLSFGGYLSLHFYHHHPEMVRALVLMGTGPGYRSPERATQWNKDCFTQADILEKKGMEGFADSEYSSILYYTPREVMLTLNPSGFARLARGAMLNPHGVDKLKDIAVPTFIIVGENDAGFRAAADYMATKIPDSEKVVIANAGHAVNIDQPDEFNNIILAFLQKIGV